MIKGFAASKAAKLLGLCVCPVGAGVVATQVPQVRSAIHRATAPKHRAPRQMAAAKTIGPRTAMTVPCPSAVPMYLSNVPVGGFSSLNAGAPVALSTALSSNGPGGGARATPGVFVTAPAETGGTPPGMGGGTPFAPVGSVPEPQTWVQLVLGFGILAATVRLPSARRSSVSLTTDGPQA